MADGDGAPASTFKTREEAAHEAAPRPAGDLLRHHPEDSTHGPSADRVRSAALAALSRHNRMRLMEVRYVVSVQGNILQEGLEGTGLTDAIIESVPPWLFSSSG